MKLSWDTITVQQFQDISRLSLETNLEDFDKVERVICILYDLTEEQVGELTRGEFAQKAREVDFVMNSPIPGRPRRTIKGGSGRYAIEYNPVKLKHRQYVEILTFGEKPIENMHLLMASIVQPIRWGFRHKNSVADHESIATDLLQAPVKDVYHSCVFFCKLYNNLIRDIKDSLVAQMMEKMSREKAEELLEISLSVMDGFTQQSSSPISKT